MVKDKITGRLIAAARALAGVPQGDFAAAAGLPLVTLQQLEAGGSALVPPGKEFTGIKAALDHFGVVVLNEAEGMGAGVRLNFTRRDVRQLTRLESEGGPVGADSAP